MKKLLFLLAFIPAVSLAEVTVSWTNQPVIGVDGVENRVYRWLYGTDPQTAETIGIVPWPGEEFVHEGTDDGLYTYCVETFGTVVLLNQIVGSGCSDSVSAVVVNDKVKKNVIPVGPAGVEIN